MLDKSVPFHRVIMHRKTNIELPDSKLPAPFSFATFTAGDEKEWAEIETSVGEFERTVDALVYFQRDYLFALREVERRTLFVQDENGRKVATFTNWWQYTGERRDPWVHWVAVRPEYQGLGIGKAMIYEGLRRMLRIEGDRDIFLCTQTWSYKAIGIYIKAGFELTKENLLGGHINEYEMAMPILKEKLR